MDPAANEKEWDTFLAPLALLGSKRQAISESLGRHLCPRQIVELGPRAGDVLVDTLSDSSVELTDWEQAVFKVAVLSNFSGTLSHARCLLSFCHAAYCRHVERPHKRQQASVISSMIGPA